MSDLNIELSEQVWKAINGFIYKFSLNVAIKESQYKVLQYISGI